MKRTTLVIVAIFLVVAGAVVVANFVIKPKDAGLALPEGSIEEIERAAKAGLPYVVKLGSDDCDACKRIDPVLVRVANELKGKVNFIRIDVYKYPKLASEHKIFVIPSLIFFDAVGEKKGIKEGFMDEAGIKSELRRFGLL